MIRIATKGLHWELLAPDDWDGDDTVHGVIHVPGEAKAWEVPIGEALARGFHPAKSRVHVETPTSITPWTIAITFRDRLRIDRDLDRGRRSLPGRCRPG